MMPYYETVFETGATSIANYASDEEALQAAGEHHRRAVEGGNAQEGLDRPAERVKAILVYDSHPGEFKQKLGLSSDVMIAELTKAAQEAAQESEGGVVTAHQVYSKLLDLNYPLHPEPARQGSRYRMEESRSLELPWNGGGE